MSLQCVVLQWPEPGHGSVKFMSLRNVNLSSITATSDHPASADQGYGAKKVILGGSGGVPLVKRLNIKLLNIYLFGI